jgi:quinolinate synthase
VHFMGKAATILSPDKTRRTPTAPS